MTRVTGWYPKDHTILFRNLCGSYFMNLQPETQEQGLAVRLADQVRSRGSQKFGQNGNKTYKEVHSRVR